MRQQVSDCRARRSGRLVELEHAFLGRDQGGEGGQQLRDRRPGKNSPRIAMRRDGLLRRADAGSGEPHRPVFDLPQGLHARRY